MKLRNAALLASIASVLAGAAACTSILGDFDVAGANGDDSGLGDASIPEDGATPDGGPGKVDGAPPPDSSPVPDAGPPVCATKCADPSTIGLCDGGTQRCAFDCATTGGPHCTIIYPTAPVEPGDIATPGTVDIKIVQDTRFVTDTGAIDNVRPPNADPLKMEVLSGIGFRLARATSSGPGVGIWTFKSLEIPEKLVVRFTQANPAAFVAATTITVAGIIDARGYDPNGKVCTDNAAGPGGGPGGLAQKNGAGPGAGSAAIPSTAHSGGPSGGAFAGQGGKGGSGSGANMPGGPSPAPYGTLALAPLVGGSGGGGAANPGGGGGGAIQLVAASRIVIGGGASVGGINAGGCNGHTGYFGSAGSAGGSGGAILVEVPSFEIAANGVIAANGGAGATGGGGSDPSPGQLSVNPAFGSITNGYGYGGNGGAGSNVQGGDATNAPAGAQGAGGAGGGAVGRIRINNRSGSFTPPNTTSVSPVFGAPTSPTTVGILDVH
jgi:hypothetical protein